MLISLGLLAAAIIGSLGNRVRGGLFPMPGGDVPARLLGWGLPCALIVASAGAAWWSLAIGAGAFVGCSMGQYGGLSMGHRPNSVTGWRAWAGMAAFGFGRVALPAAVTGWCGGAWWLVLTSGLLAPVIYDAVWRVPPAIYQRGFGYGGGPPAYDPPELAEAAHGAIMAIALFLTWRFL